MKIYYPKIQIKEIHIYPFQFLSDWMDNIELFFASWTMTRKFKKCNWDWNTVWDMTRYSGSLEEAVESLKLELTDDSRLYPKARKLVYSGYDRDWK